MGRNGILIIIAVVVIGVIGYIVVQENDKTPLEEFGDSVEDAADDVGDSIDDAADDVDDSTR